MQHKDSGKKPAKQDHFQQQATQLVSLYFDHTTPAFVRDLLASFFCRLEDVTQVSAYSRRTVCAAWLPVALAEAAAQGFDVEDPRGAIYTQALGESLNVNGAHDRCERRPSEGETARREIERDAEALARLLNSPRVPERIKDDLANRFFEWSESQSLSPGVLRERCVNAALRDMDGAREGAADE